MSAHKTQKDMAEKRKPIKLTPTPHQVKLIEKKRDGTTKGLATVVSEMLDDVVKGRLKYADGRKFFDE